MAALANISSEARSVMVACFAEGLPDPMIAARVKAETGEELAERTIGRRKSEWKAEAQRSKAGRERMANLLAAAKGGNFEASEMINALAIEQLMDNPDGTLVDPIELQRLSIAAERVRLQRDRLELARRQIALEEEKFKMLQEREKRAIAVLGDGSEVKLTAEEIVRNVKDIYGLK